MCNRLYCTVLYCNVTHLEPREVRRARGQVGLEVRSHDGDSFVVKRQPRQTRMRRHAISKHSSRRGGHRPRSRSLLVRVVVVQEARGHPHHRNTRHHQVYRRARDRLHTVTHTHTHTHHRVTAAREITRTPQHTRYHSVVATTPPALFASTIAGRASSVASPPRYSASSRHGPLHCTA